MEKRKLGQLEVSEIGMGCMGFSHGYGQVPSENESIDAIQAAYQAGCTFLIRRRPTNVSNSTPVIMSNWSAKPSNRFVKI